MEEQEQYEQEPIESTGDEGVIGEQNDVIELEPAPEPTEEELAQKKINDRFAEVTNQRLQAEQKAAEAERALKERDEELAKFKAVDTDIIVPPIPEMPDYPDENDRLEFNRKMTERDELLQKKVNLDIQRDQKSQADKATLQSVLAEEQKARQAKTDAYWEKAKSSGHDEKNMAEYGKAVYNTVNGDLISDFIMPHEQGPSIVKYLATNLLEADKLKQMSGFQAASYIDTKIVPNLPKKIKQTPPEKVYNGNPPAGKGGSGKKAGHFY